MVAFQNIVFIEGNPYLIQQNIGFIDGILVGTKGKNITLSNVAVLKCSELG